MKNQEVIISKLDDLRKEVVYEASQVASAIAELQSHRDALNDIAKQIDDIALCAIRANGGKN